MKYQIGVIGSAISEDESINLKARKVGETIAKLGHIIVTGGCGGIPYEATLGAKEYGGLTIAISPASNREEHIKEYGFPSDFDVIIYTGFGKKGRNVPFIRSCEAVVAIAGRIGTLNELTIAYDEKKIIGILKDSGGISDRFEELVQELGKPGGKIIASSDPEELVKKVIEELSK